MSGNAKSEDIASLTQRSSETQVKSWIKSTLARKNSWNQRREAAGEIGGLARDLRKFASDKENDARDREIADKLLSDLLKHLAEKKNGKSFADFLIEIAIDLRLGEPLRRTAAWVLGEINEWPRPFEQKVLRDRKLQSRIGIDASLAFMPELPLTLSAIESTEPGDIRLAESFVPHLDGIGFELRWDTLNHYLGPFFRVMNYPGKKKEEKKCIQYLYIWSRQLWPISGFFSFYLWPLLSALAILPWITNMAIGAIAPVLIGACLIGTGIYRTLRPKEMKCVKNETLYIVGGTLLLLSLLFQPWGALVPLVAAVILFLLIKYVLGEIEHVMDYAPVFLYLSREGEKWEIERARIDKWHYESVEFAKKRDGLQDQGKYLDEHVREKSLFLETDNIWHSLKFAKPHGEHSSGAYDGYFWTWIALFVSTASLVGIGLLKAIFPALQFGWFDGYWLVVYSSLSVMILLVLNEKATTAISASIADPAKPLSISRFQEEPEKRVLVNSKLAHLWNMSDEKANLIIREKLQNPWRTASDFSFWRTFRDPSPDKLAYETLSRVKNLERSAGKHCT